MLFHPSPRVRHTFLLSLHFLGGISGVTDCEPRQVADRLKALLIEKICFLGLCKNCFCENENSYLPCECA